jgi:hypothetical protein
VPPPLRRLRWCCPPIPSTRLEPRSLPAGPTIRWHPIPT